jgi:hypothetical protein
LIGARKISANRANARASTGPKTAQGRARASRNSLRHGLSLAVHADPAWCEEAEALAREIAGIHPNTEIRDLACRIADAQIDICRVRYARRRLLSTALSQPYYESRADRRTKLAVMQSLLRQNAPDIPIANLTSFLTSTPEGPQKLALILSQEAKQLMAMDRYERRALSRRKSAIRAVDEAKRRLVLQNAAGGAREFPS